MARKFSVFSYDIETEQLVATQHGNLDDADCGKAADGHPICRIDPTGSMCVLGLYDGLITVVPLLPKENS